MIFTTEIFLFTVRGSLWIGIYLIVMGIGAWLLISFLESSLNFARKRVILTVNVLSSTNNSLSQSILIISSLDTI